MKFLSFLPFLLLPCISFSQVDKKIDSVKIEKLDQVVITGQLSPQSVEKSVVEVKVISRKTIERLAGNTLADVLNTTLNLNITPNTTTGKSGVSLFGLDGQYFKVLIDNIPIINEEGVGNNTDLTLINLDDIERIEIVEGAMGVQYGANAVSGIINIITKKSSKNDWELSAYIQEETIGDEYKLFNRGRHIQSLRLGHNLSEKVYANVVFTRNDFAGFYNNKLGENYDQNDGLRGLEWLPKLQQNGKAVVSFTDDNFKLFYRFDYVNETIDRYNDVVNPNENPSTDTTDPLALDEIYTNNRWYHHLNGTGIILDGINYNLSVSYQSQTKDLERYTYRIRAQEKLNIEKGEYQSRSAFFSRGTLSNLLKSNRIGLQTGYELTNERGSGSSLAIVIEPGEELVSQQLNNYDFFTSSEVRLSDNFFLRPGIRVSFSNLFENQYIGSLSAKQTFKNNWELRAIVGSANRTPNYNELYTFFVDVNHNVQGNSNLNPERGISTFLHLKKSSSLNGGAIRVKNKLSLNYLSLKDRIELIVVNQTPLEFQYNNIDSYKAAGIFSENEVYYNNLKAQLGVSVQGVSKILDSRTGASDDFLFNFQLNANLGYSIPKYQTTFSLFFKHIGEQQQFVEKTNEEGKQEFQVGETDPYSWMDATINKSFLDKSVILTLGSRNLFNVTSVNSTAFEGGAHNGPPTQIPLGYGRSYFLKLSYNLNI
ncbi:MAG: TonB-dependent receptor plug domain-containing protein [Flavobacteriaceae bacterium]|nr:TonB-dependent receptor plug domain-containing protein [Flavobacteriaceae bacterium]